MKVLTRIKGGLMMYLIATNGSDLDSKTAKRFGHANTFLLVNGDTMEFKVVDRQWDDVPQHMVDALLSMNVEVVISGNIGPDAFERLNANNIKVYICRSMTGREAIEKVIAGDCLPAEKSTLKRSIHENRRNNGGPNHYNARQGKKNHGRGR